MLVEALDALVEGGKVGLLDLTAGRNDDRLLAPARLDHFAVRHWHQAQLARDRSTVIRHDFFRGLPRVVHFDDVGGQETHLLAGRRHGARRCRKGARVRPAQQHDTKQVVTVDQGQLQFAGRIWETSREPFAPVSTIAVGPTNGGPMSSWSLVAFSAQIAWNLAKSLALKAAQPSW